LKKTEILGLNLLNNERNIIKNFIKNSDIIKYHVNFSEEKLIYLQWEDNIDDFPNIKKHLLRFKNILTDQAERYGENYPWFALHRPRKQSIFEASEKIVVPYRSE
jgi:adenine-specific DNA-methyltransferase